MKSIKQYIFVKEAQEEKNISVKEWQKKYQSGAWDSSSVKTMCEAGWWDWFCKDSSLKKRLEKLAPIVLGITNPTILNNYYIWFKNNQPISGPTYDDIRFEPLDESQRDKKYFVITCNDKRNPSKFHIWTMKDDNNPGVGFKTVKELIKAINEYKFL